MITAEGQRLGRRWDRAGLATLDRYLIQDVEHPAYNIQSVLMRAFFMDRLVPGGGRNLIEEELYFAACCNYALMANRSGRFPEIFRKVKHGCPETELPAFLNSLHQEKFGARFNLPDLYSSIAVCLAAGFDDFSSPFATGWREFLEARATPPCRVLEIGCGSANDYRFLDSYGLGQRLHYSGLDVSEANIANARRRFPHATFNVGDVCAIDAADREFDVCFAFDVYEHLSVEALQQALHETCRVTRDELWLSFFNAANIPDHVITPVEDYHWNTLSLPQLQEVIEGRGFSVQIVSPAHQLERRCAGYHHYNQNAYMLIATRIQS